MLWKGGKGGGGGQLPLDSKGSWSRAQVGEGGAGVAQGEEEVLSGVHGPMKILQSMYLLLSPHLGRLRQISVNGEIQWVKLTQIAQNPGQVATKQLGEGAFFLRYFCCNTFNGTVAAFQVFPTTQDAAWMLMISVLLQQSCKVGPYGLPTAKERATAVIIMPKDKR